jgi:hypothetical protein
MSRCPVLSGGVCHRVPWDLYLHFLSHSPAARTAHVQ